MKSLHLILGLVFCGLMGCSSTSFKGSDSKKSATEDKSADVKTPTEPTTPSNTGTDTAVDVADKAGTNAVTKGSFTAWTVPASPKEYEQYKIIIRVTVPAATSGYGASDLSGNLVGTDSYRQNLQNSVDNYGIPSSPEFKRDGTYAYLGIMVPGARSKVEDDISIHSTLLNESQTLTLLFQ